MQMVKEHIRCGHASDDPTCTVLIFLVSDYGLSQVIAGFFLMGHT